MKVFYRAVVSVMEGELSIDPNATMENVNEIVRNKIKDGFIRQMSYRWSVVSTPAKMREDDIISRRQESE